MRTLVACAVSAMLLLANSCSRDKSPEAPPASKPAATASETPAAPAQDQIFSAAQLDAMVAPIALYPDKLLAQVFMASTYPGDVADAVAWSKANPKATGDAAVKQVADQPWDPSVQSLAAFPPVLGLLGSDPGWVQNLGDAVLAQPKDVMDAVQRLRHKAQAAGSLAQNEHQQVKSEPAPVAGEPETIVLESSNPEEVYVPSYDPNAAYGEWEDTQYPPPAYYAPQPAWYPGAVLGTAMVWGASYAVADALWGDVNWNDDDFDIDVDSYNNINVNNIDVNNNNWNHNAANRDGVPYRGEGNREKYGRQLDGANERQAYRGDDGARAKQREQAQSAMRERNGGPAAGTREQPQRAGATQERKRQQGQTNAASRDGARQQARSQQGPRNDAMSGASRSSQTTRSQQQRGSQSQSRTRSSTSGGSGGSRSGQQASRSSSAPQRSGSGSRR